MRMRKFIFNPVDYQNPNDVDRANKLLKDAVHVETYTTDEGRFGGQRTIIIFAFYPDKKKRFENKKQDAMNHIIDGCFEKGKRQ
jgi:hypothetical protein